MKPVFGFAGDALGLVPVMLLLAGLSVGSAALALVLGAHQRALGAVTEM